MAASYIAPFKGLQGQILNYSPKAAALLESMHQECDAQAAFYAAYIIVGLHAERDLTGDGWVDEITPSDLQSYIFFEYARDELLCMALFDMVLTTYQGEQRPPTNGAR